MRLSVIIPAYNEEKYLDATLRSVKSGLRRIKDGELIVVDNASTDGTRAIAETLGAKIVDESVHNISRVRNTGGRSAAGDVLVFVDADTIVPAELFEKILEVMSDDECFGGSVAVRYGESTRRWIKYYLMGWQFWGRVLKMRQGAAQFCRRGAFEELGGYDETIFMGEDVEFQWRLRRLARSRGGFDAYIEDLEVLTSARRYSKMGLVRTLVLTHPITLFLLWRRGSVWKDWYENAVR